ncbi:hypothetical protein YS9_3362 [Enterococcus sp. C1]|uniref:hypothetical protein n=1 Tax=Enterococcus sp. C1 TaxID=1182762 RepID=UPI0002721947|nr:hypothetical protein [Enterococcus sp. C1]EJF48059.1 hypothetical protein YS9_3362 [Enterococcus sp. C1]
MKKIAYLSLLAATVLGLTTFGSRSVYADNPVQTIDGRHDWGNSDSKFPNIPTIPNKPQKKYVASILSYTMFGDPFSGTGLPKVKYEAGVLNFRAKITDLNPGSHTIKNANIIGHSRGKVIVFGQIGQTTNEWIEFNVRLSEEDLKTFNTFTVNVSYQDNLWGQNAQARASINLSLK